MKSRILLLSDIHADSRSNNLDDGDPPLSRVRTDSDTRGTRDAWESLLQLPLGKIDHVFVAGDICNMADENALRAIWPHIRELADNLGAELYAVPGNHDLDSRFQTSVDPRLAIQYLPDGFPDRDSCRNDQFWARHFLIDTLDTGFADGPVLLVRLNSAAYHGYAREYEHGRITRYTADEITRRIDEAQPSLVIVLTHHHLFPRPDSSAEENNDFSTIEGSHLLLQASDHSRIPWIIIHGHRHIPQVFYSVGSATSPVVVSLGSLGANLTGMESGLMNTFHILELEQANYRGVPHGEVLTYVFGVGSGWLQAGDPRIHGMPGRLGFGSRRHPSELAAQITSALNPDHPILKEAEVLSACPEIRYQLPQDMETLKMYLETDMDVEYSHETCKLSEVRLRRDAMND